MKIFIVCYLYVFQWKERSYKENFQNIPLITGLYGYNDCDGNINVILEVSGSLNK